MSNTYNLNFYQAQNNKYYLSYCEQKDGQKIGTILVLPQNISTVNYGIWTYAFWGERTIKRLIMPSRLIEIKNEAFVGSVLEEIEFKSNQPPIIANLTFSGLSPDKVKIIVPLGSKTRYENNSMWISAFKNAGLTFAKNLEESRSAIADADILPPLYLAGQNIETLTITDAPEAMGEMPLLGTTIAGPIEIDNTRIDLINDCFIAVLSDTKEWELFKYNGNTVGAN